MKPEAIQASQPSPAFLTIAIDRSRSRVLPVKFELMVAGGMPPMKAIQSATLEAARLLRIEDRLGTIEAKMIADVVAVKGNPLKENISAS